MYSSSSFTGLESANSGWIGFSLIVSIIAGILVYILFINKNKNKQLDGFKKKLYDFLSFDSLILESILKVSYIVFMLFITLSSFSLITKSFFGFLSTLIFGNLLLRLVLELSLMLINLWRNVRDIRRLLENKQK